MTSISTSCNYMYKRFAILFAAIFALLVFLLVLSNDKQTLGMITFAAEKVKSFSAQAEVEWKGTRDVLPPCGVNAPEYPREMDSLPLFNGSICDQTALVDIRILRNISWSDSLDGVIVGHTACPRTAIQAPMNLPSTGLTTWPGSGNTWTRHLIEQLTGIQSGAVYNDKGLRNKGFRGEGRTSGVVVVKTHLTSVASTRIVHFNRQIVVLRNPFDALAAEYKRGMMMAGHTKKVDIPIDSKWEKYVQDRTLRWSYFVRSCLAFRLPQLIIMYEDMKSPCLARELLQMANFLRTDKLTKFSLCCALSNSVGKSYRNQTRAPLKELFKGKLMDDMNAMLTELAQDVSYKFPVLAERLRDYRIYNHTVL